MELPPELKASDQILIYRDSGEILIFPQDEIKADFLNPTSPDPDAIPRMKILVTVRSVVCATMLDGI